MKRFFRGKYVYRIRISITEVAVYTTLVYVRSFMFYRHNSNAKYTWYVCFPCVSKQNCYRVFYFMFKRSYLMTGWSRRCISNARENTGFLHASVYNSQVLLSIILQTLIDCDNSYENNRVWSIWSPCIPRPSAKDNYNKMASTINCNYLHGLWHWQSLDKIRSIDLLSADRSYITTDFYNHYLLECI